jgi:16S rRNA processing protein RimM
MGSEAFVPLARVVKTHGIKGEVSVAPAADLPFAPPIGLWVWFTPPPAGVKPGRIESVRRGPKGPLVKVSGIDDLTTSHKLLGCSLMVREGDLPVGWDEVEEEFSADGMRVEDVVRGNLGEIVETIVTGANDVWVIEGPLGEVLLPVISQVVLKIDEKARVITVRALDGLLPE